MRKPLFDSNINALNRIRTKTRIGETLTGAKVRLLPEQWMKLQETMNKLTEVIETLKTFE